MATAVPFFAPLLGASWLVFTAQSDLVFVLFAVSCVAAVLGPLGMAVRSWRRSRWRAYGNLAGLALAATLFVVLALLAVGLMASGIKG